MHSLTHMPQDTVPADAPLADPWEAADPEQGERRDSWLLSYVDILTLILTLFVLLLALQPKESPAPATAPEVGAQTVGEPAPPPTTQAEAVTAPSKIVSTEIAPALTVETPPAPAAPSPLLLTAVLPTVPPLLWPAPTGLPVVPDAWYVPTADAPPAPTESEPAVEDHNVAAPVETVSPADDLARRIEAAGLTDRVQVSALAQGMRLEIRDQVLFAPGNAELTPAGRAVLDELASMFASQSYGISVEGHTDDRPIRTGRFPSNWELSTGRASQVARHLIERGLAAERLHAVGYADTRPLSDNGTSEGRAHNRRVSLVLEMPPTTPQ